MPLLAGPTDNLDQKRFIAPFFFANGLIYSLTAIYNNYLPYYMRDAGYSDASIGTLMSIGPLVSIFALVIWGAAADKSKLKNNVLMLLTGCSAAAFAALYFNRDFRYLLVMLGVLMFFMSPLGGLVDTLTLEYSFATRRPYGPMRIMATIFYGVFTLILTVALPYIPGWGIFAGFAFLALSAILSVRFAAPIEGHAHEKHKLDFKPFLRDRTLWTIFLLMAAVQFCCGFFQIFTGNFMRDEMKLPEWIFGILIVMTVAGELVFFGLIDRIFRRFGIKRVALVTLVGSVLRYGLFSLFAAAFVDRFAGMIGLLAASLLTGPLMTVMTYCASYYIINTARPELKASGMTLMYALTFNLPRMLAGLLGGMMRQAIGFPLSMLVCAGICAAVLALTPLLPFNADVINKEKQNG